jgi:hypothetical protein
MRLSHLIAGCLVVFSSPPSWAQVYKCMVEGKTIYQQSPCLSSSGKKLDMPSVPSVPNVPNVPSVPSVEKNITATPKDTGSCMWQDFYTRQVKGGELRWTSCGCYPNAASRCNSLPGNICDPTKFPKNPERIKIVCQIVPICDDKKKCLP